MHSYNQVLNLTEGMMVDYALMLLGLATILLAHYPLYQLSVITSTPRPSSPVIATFL